MADRIRSSWILISCAAIVFVAIAVIALRSTYIQQSILLRVRSGDIRAIAAARECRLSKISWLLYSHYQHFGRYPHSDQELRAFNHDAFVRYVETELPNSCGARLFIKYDVLLDKSEQPRVIVEDPGVCWPSNVRAAKGYEQRLAEAIRMLADDGRIYTESMSDVGFQPEGSWPYREE